MARKATGNPAGRPPKPEGEAKDVLVAVRIRAELNARMKARADADKKPVSEVVRLALESYLG